MLPWELHVLWDRGFASHPKQLLHHLGWENWFGGGFNTVLGSQGQCFTIPLIQKTLPQCGQLHEGNWELRKTTALS